MMQIATIGWPRGSIDSMRQRNAQPFVRVADLATGAFLKKGRRYPLANGGWIEFVRVAIGWPYGARVLVRIDRDRVPGIYRWIPARYDWSRGILWISTPRFDYPMMRNIVILRHPRRWWRRFRRPRGRWRRDRDPYQDSPQPPAPENDED